MKPLENDLLIIDSIQFNSINSIKFISTFIHHYMSIIIIIHCIFVNEKSKRICRKLNKLIRDIPGKQQMEVRNVVLVTSRPLFKFLTIIGFFQVSYQSLPFKQCIVCSTMYTILNLKVWATSSSVAWHGINYT